MARAMPMKRFLSSIKISIPEMSVATATMIIRVNTTMTLVSRRESQLK